MMDFLKSPKGRVRAWIVFYIAVLLFWGVTTFPLAREMHLLYQFLNVVPLGLATAFPALMEWLTRVDNALQYTAHNISVFGLWHRLVGIRAHCDCARVYWPAARPDKKYPGRRMGYVVLCVGRTAGGGDGTIARRDVLVLPGASRNA